MIPLRLLRTWAIVLASVFVIATTLFAILGVPISVQGGRASLGWIEPVIAGALAALGVTPIAFVLSALRTKDGIGARFDESRCPHCDYDLTGLESDRCPECGRAIEQP